MREIKFRTWFENQMVTISSFVQQDEQMIRFQGYTKDLKMIGKDSYSDNLMQYTGIKDSNGVEIYESDILKITEEDLTEHISDVLYHADGGYPAFDLNDWYFDFENSVDNALALFTLSNAKVEVIGNIYENSELLED